MTVPNRQINVLDGGNGVSLGSGPTRALVGVSSTGTYNTPYSFASTKDIGDTLGYGPLVDAAKYEVENGGGTIICFRGVDSVAGAITTGAPTQDGDGTCAASGTPNNRYRIAVEITTAGELGTGAFKYALDAGQDDTLEEYRNWSQPTAIPAGGTYAIPNTGITLTFANGTPVSFQLGDTFYFSTTAPSFQLADLNNSLDALAAYSGYWRYVHVIGEITAAIAAGIDTKVQALLDSHKYRYAICQVTDVDPIGTVTAGGTTPPVLTVTGIPVESWNMKVDVVTGGALGTMVFRWSSDGGNTYSANITSDVSGVHADMGLGMTFTFAAGTYAADNEYTWETWDKNRATWAAALITSYVSFTSDRVMLCAGFGEATHPDGKIRRTPLSWAASAVTAKKSISTDLGHVVDAGILPGFLTYSHDEAANPSLDDAGFCTMRTWEGRDGIYFTQGRIKAPPASDYDLQQYREVMDEACRVLDVALQTSVNDKVRVSRTTGFIDERDARAYDRKFDTPVRLAIVTPGHASGLVVRTRRDENLLSTRLMTVDLEVTGLAYLKTLVANIGYVNPALQPVEV